jgi:hypothetical protein
MGKGRPLLPIGNYRHCAYGLRHFRAYEEMEGRKIEIKKLKIGKCNNTKQNIRLKK